VILFRRILNVTATDGRHFSDVMPIVINLVETEGFQADTSLNGENSLFECRETGVAQRLAKIMLQSEKSNRIKEEFPPTSSRYLGNIHYPVFQRIPQTFYVNETAPLGSLVFQVSPPTGPYPLSFVPAI
jgi:protocadherin Fat 1/2/3